MTFCLDILSLRDYESQDGAPLQALMARSNLANWLEGRIEKKLPYVVRVAEHGTQVLGCFLAQVVLHEAELLALVVDESFRRQGVGGRLLRDGLEVLTHAGVEEVHLEVRGENRPAMALYQANGFESVGLRKGYYSDPTDDALLMRWVRRSTDL
jgi:[ribosomal protein S18]-alanine N-acetyltransferase